MSTPGAGVTAIVEFLLARIAEDEETATRIECMCAEDSPTEWQAGCPDRILAECQAKRDVIAFAKYLPSAYAKSVLQPMTVPYSDHPDWREEWKR